jgi:hypothetical protein
LPTRPVKRTLFTPLCALTANRPTVRHTGETCCTVKTTFARCRRTNVSVVARRCLPFVPIQGRDVCSLETADCAAGPPADAGTPTVPPATAPNGDEDDPPPPVLDVEPAGPAPVLPPAGETPRRGDEDVPAEDVTSETEACAVVTLGTDALGVVATGVDTDGVVTDGVVTDGTVTDGTVTGGGGGGGSGGGDGVVTVGVVTVVTGGTGTVTLGTVADGTVGVGTRSASACSARRPTPKSKPSPQTRTRMAAPLTHLQLRCGRFGCAPGASGNIPREWRR